MAEAYWGTTKQGPHRDRIATGPRPVATEGRPSGDRAAPGSGTPHHEVRLHEWIDGSTALGEHTMNTRRRIATIVSTVTLAAATAAAPAAATGIAQRLDPGGVVRTPVLDDCILANPCRPVGVTVPGNARQSATGGGAGLSAATPARNVHLWSYAEDGSLELRIDGVLSPRPAPPL